MRAKLKVSKLSRAAAGWLALNAALACHDPLPDLAADPAASSTTPPPPVFVPTPRDAGVSPPASSTFHPMPSPEPPLTPLDPDAGEPRRDPALTLLHALVDTRHLYLCRTDSTGQIAADAELEPPGGLVFGQHWVWSEDELEFASELGWWLLGSEQELPGGMSCRTALEQATTSLPDAGTDAGPPQDAASPEQPRDAGVADARVPAADATLDAAPRGPVADAAVQAVVVPSLRSRPFITLPAGSLADGRSTLLVAAGCLGGFDVADSTWCGTSDPHGSDALRPVFVPLSRRTTFSALGLQALNASTVQRTSVRSAPREGASGTLLSLATDLPQGQLWPRQANTSISLEDLGDDLAQVELQLVLGLGDEPGVRQTWQQALDFGGGLSLQHGRAYSLLFIGAVVPATVTGLNAARFVVIDNDPLVP